MSVFIADRASESLPNIDYCIASNEQIAYALAAAKRMTGFEVQVMPISTLEEALASAQEWAGYRQAKGDLEARKRGAFLVMGGRDFPEADEMATTLYQNRASKGLLKTVIAEGLEWIDLWRDYYNLPAE